MLALSPDLREDLETVCRDVPVDDGGGSSPLKAALLAELIVANDLNRIVEIGVYRGRLLLPLARLMTRLGRGEVVGIDPYSAAAAVQQDVEREGIDLLQWPSTVDWEALHDEVVRAISRWGLERRVRLIRERSEEAAAGFSEDPIDLLHVDGNHDRQQVERDIDLYLPHLSEGAFLVLDDIAWPSVRPVYQQLTEEHELVFSLIETGLYVQPEDGPNDFAVLRT